MTTSALHAALEAFLALYPTLHDLIRGGGEVLDVVIQDEFTHDVIAWVPTPMGLRLAVFDST